MDQSDLIIAGAFVAITVLCIAWLWITRYKTPVDPFRHACRCIHPIKCNTFDRCMKNEHS